MDRFSALLDLINDAEGGGLLVQPVAVSGLSGAVLLGTLQRIAKHQEASGCYAEIGVFQGLTLISVAKAISGKAYGIDNFSQFDPTARNKSIVEDRIAKNAIENVALVNRDYEDALDGWPVDQKISTYFVDGPHDYRSQLMCLLLALPLLSHDAVIVVDDSNYRHVRQANCDFLKTHPEFALLFEAYTARHPENMSRADRQEAERGWWNGVNIIVRDAGRTLPRTYPPTDRDRTLFVNEHIVHAARYAAIAPEAVSMLSAFPNPYRMALYLAKIMRGARKKPSLVGEHPAMNTFSQDLPKRKAAR